MELKKMFESLCLKRKRRMANAQVQSFRLDELVAATGKFHEDCLLGEGGRMAIAQEERFRLDELVAATAKFHEDCLLGEGGRMAIEQGQRFTLDELVAATGKFHKDCLLGEGGFGKVYKGHVKSYNQVVAIKQLDINGGTDEFIDQVGSYSRSMDHPNYLNLYGYRVKRDRKPLSNDEFVDQVACLSRSVDHPNLVKLYGYCVERDQRLLVNEYMPLGSLESHLHDLPPSRKGLDWNTRIKIAAGVAKGLEYLHVTLQQPYREFKCSRILLGEDYHPKLSDFGLRKLMGTATDYVGERNEDRIKLDVYLFGVLLLELLSGRKPYDPVTNQHLVQWARPLLFDRKKFSAIADPKLEGQYPLKGLYFANSLAGACVLQELNTRTVISDVVIVLDYIASQQYNPTTASAQVLESMK